MNRTLPALLIGVSVFGTTLPGPLFAQEYPSRPIRLVVPWPPGGGTDVIARLIAAKLSDSLGQQVVVDNRPGAASNIGMASVAQAAPDGYTIALATSNLAVNPALFSPMTFDPARDLAPITTVAKGTYALALNPAVPARTVAELIALVRAAPGKYNASTAGAGSPGHLAVAQFNSMTRADLTAVHYKGGGPAAAATLAGETQMMFSSYTTMAPLVKSGRLHLLAVTGPRRSLAVPDVPTVAESGLPGFVFEEWYALFAPAKTARERIDRLNAEVRKVLAQPDVRDRILSLGAEVGQDTPEVLGAMVTSEIARWGALVRAAGIKAD